MNTTVAEIAAIVGGTVIGDGSTPITGINGIRQAASGDITFLADPRYFRDLETTKASAILGPPDLTVWRNPIIQVPDPYLAVAALLKRVQADMARRPEGVHPSAVVGTNVQLGEGVALGPYAVVGDDCRIGDGTVVYPGAYIAPACRVGMNCVIFPNVTIREYTTVGDRCTIHAGAVIGSDGFGFANVDGKHEKIPQVGIVVIGNDVEIGANSAIDRATFGQTTIGDGTKIDNLVQIGHNTRIGRHTVICGNAGVAGSTIIGDRVTVAAGAGLAGHMEVGDGATIGAYSGVSKSVKPGQTVFGYPAVEHGRSKRMHAALRQLPEALRLLKSLERRIAELEGLANGTPEDDS
jgi:UDP-3-O-[3-hydroxymyristoyl] glucosamine N-acyltransferase